MTDSRGVSDADNGTMGRLRRNTSPSERNGVRRRRRYVVASAWLAFTAVLAVAATAWLGTRATIIKDELEASAQLIIVLKDDIAGGKTQQAQETSDTLRSHASAAR